MDLGPDAEPRSWVPARCGCDHSSLRHRVPRVAGPNWGTRLGAIVFGAAMIALYTTSSLYHGVPWDLAWKKRMQRVDHTMIIVLIAGTYTPPTIVALDGWAQWAFLAFAWGAVAIGVIQHSFFPREKQGFSMALGATMGWLGILIAWKFVVELGWTAALLGLIGGAVYTVGMVLLITNWPKLWPRVFSYHELCSTSWSSPEPRSTL